MKEKEEKQLSGSGGGKASGGSKTSPLASQGGESVLLCKAEKN